MSDITPNPLPDGATVLSCSLHKTHHPEPCYCELHHVIPRDWQQVWSPPSFNQRKDENWPYARLVDGQWLWDARVDSLCRTGHGNTHFYLVKLMHWASERPGLTYSGQLEYSMTLLRHTFRYTDPAAVREAVQAMTRWTSAGGSLQALWSAHSWGQI